jgi:hypothetical protein
MGDSYYGVAPKRYTVANLVIGSVGAGATSEVAVAGLTGVKLGDTGFVTPDAAPIDNFNFMYFRGTGNGTGVIGVQNVSAGALDPADTMDVTIVLFPKAALSAAVTDT